MPIKFIHISDTHLGFSDLDILENGRNIREEDIYEAFSDAVDIILKEKPDFVLHSGDIFHRSSPSNRALVVAFDQLRRITDAEIPFYMIAGNHDFPKSVFTSPIHDLYQTNDLVHIAFDEKLEVVETENYIIHLLPHINGEEKFFKEIDKIKITDKSKPNILSMHVAISSYAMNEFGERVIRTEDLRTLKKFDYVALGHWHRFNHLSKYGNVCYAGSTERTSDAQTGYDKGIALVTIDKETKIKFLPLKLRRYEKIIIKKCDAKNRDKIIDELKKKVNSSPVKGGIFHVRLADLPKEKSNDIPRTVYEDIFKDALHFSVSKLFKGINEIVTIDSESFDLKEYFFDEIGNNFKGAELKKIMEYSRRLWDELDEEDANADS